VTIVDPCLEGNGFDLALNVTKIDVVYEGASFYSFQFAE